MAVEYTIKRYDLSERRVCRALKIHRSAVRYEPLRRDDEDDLVSKINYLACNYGRYGYRRITAVLRNQGYNINHKRVERIWREQGLKVPQKQPKKRRLFLNDGSCIRLRPGDKNHVWTYDFVEDRTMDGRKIRFLNV